jgi:hypothetical protein
MENEMRIRRKGEGETGRERDHQDEESKMEEDGSQVQEETRGRGDANMETGG